MYSQKVDSSALRPIRNNCYLYLSKKKMITEKHVQRGRYMCYIKYTVQKRASRCKAIRQTDATPISPGESAGLWVGVWALRRCKHGAKKGKCGYEFMGK